MGCLDSSHKRTITYPVRQTRKMSREAVPNSNHCIRVGTACDKGVWPFEAAAVNGRIAQISLKKSALD